MFEVGKPRTDGKYNVWHKRMINNRWEWVVVEVCDSYPEALELAASENQKHKRRKSAGQLIGAASPSLK